MWMWLLVQVMNYSVGRDAFRKITSVVTEVSLDVTLSGVQKKDVVVENIKAGGQDIASHILNLAIEVAVTLVKDKYG